MKTFLPKLFIAISLLFIGSNSSSNTKLSTLNINVVPLDNTSTNNGSYSEYQSTSFWNLLSQKLIKD